MTNSSRLRFYAVLAFVGLEVMTVAGFYTTTLTELKAPPSPAFSCSSTPCIESALIGLAGFGLVVWSLRGIFRDLVRGGYLPIRTPKSIPQIGAGPDDQRILALANDLLAQTRVRRLRSIETLAWQENQPWYVCGLGRESLRKPTTRLVLSSGLRGRLGPDDWKLLLPYLFLQFKPPRLIVVRGISRMVLAPTLLIFLPVGAISFTYGRLAAGLYATVVGPAASVLTLMWISLSAKRFFLKVDEQIAKSMGSEALMSIFRRIDELRLPDVENGKRRRGWIARLWPMPNMTERLDHLRALGSR